MRDYKYEMQLLAEQAAEDKHGRDFSELPTNVQNDLYSDAMGTWHDNMADKAENARDAARDEEIGL